MIKTTIVNQEKTKELIRQAMVATNSSPKEGEILKSSLVTEIIIATALLSGCRNPERIIISHLCSFMADIRNKEIFGHKPGETLFSRLESANHYPGGDQEYIKAGMLLLEYLSLNDHKEDLSNDIINGKENPLIMEMDFEKEKERIQEKYDRLSLKVRLDFLPLYEKVIKAAFWA